MDLTQAWTKLLPHQRWFAGKSRLIRSVALRADRWEIEPDRSVAVRFEYLDVTYDDDTTETYRLLSAYRRLDQALSEFTLAVVELAGIGERAMSDATADPIAFGAYVKTFARDFEIRPWSEARPLSGEQSNSSVRISPNHLYKLYRRPFTGWQREHVLLSRLIFNPAVPRLRGTFHDTQRRVQAIITDFVQDAEDGWTMATRACRDDTDISPAIADLGRALRSIHLTLSDRHDDQRGRLFRSSAETVQGFLAGLQQTIAECADIAGLADPLGVVFAAIGDDDIPVHQIHGDFHLGQALWQSDQRRWQIIDFEGEPSRTPAERERPDSPWRDVAGALRSLDYARSQHPAPTSAPARTWVHTHQQAFLDGYAAGEAIPEALLRAYQLDKALYELRYETTNRPEWAQFPLQAVQDEANRFSAHGTEA